MNLENYRKVHSENNCKLSSENNRKLYTEKEDNVNAGNKHEANLTGGSSSLKKCFWDSLSKESISKEDFSLQDIEQFSLPFLEEAGIPEAELDLRLLMQEAFSLDTKDYLLGKREALSAFYRKREAHSVFNQKSALGESADSLVYSSGALDSALTCFFSFLEKRLERIPLSQILGRQEFFGLSFLVNENVLIPRQDTECIVERILLEETKEKRKNGGKRSGKSEDIPGRSAFPFAEDANTNEKQLSVLDLCTGSGCIGLTLVKHLNCKTILLLDKSGKALEVARENYRRLFLEEEERIANVEGERLREQKNRASVYFLESDLFSSLPSFMEEKEVSGFDILVSNPPYIRRDVVSTLDDEVALHEPRMALDGGIDGLDFYRRIAKEGKRFLLPGGRVYLEIGYDQGESVKNIFQKEGYREVEVFPDYEGRDRGLYATLQLDTNKTIHYY